MSAAVRRHSRPSDMNPPDMQQRQTRNASLGEGMPPGATGTSSATSSAANNYNLRTEEALLNAPSRISQPHLHPNKLNIALWFGVDPSVHKFIRTTWQAYYMGPWSSWKFIPNERIDTWWHTFVQNYYWEDQFLEEVHYRWTLHTQTSICQKISRKHRDNVKPKFISEDDWAILMKNWDTLEAKQKSQSAADSRTSDPYGKWMHKHCAGPKCFLQIEHEMTIELGGPPAFTDIVRRTHSRNGTFIDGRAKSIVLETEEAVAEMSTGDGSPNSDSPTASTAATTRILLNQEYVKRGQSSKGKRIYGLGSVQFRDFNPSQKVAASLKRSLDMEMCISGLETNSEAVNTNVEALKADMISLKGDMASTLASVNAILLTLQQGSHSVHATQPPPTTHAQTPATNHAQTPTSTHAHDPSMNQTQQADLERWCAAELGMS